MPTGGELLVRQLEALGIPVAFGLPGVHNLPAWKAFSSSTVRLIGVRHEQTAVYAADGYARATGQVGIALTTTGPGAANALGATGEAWASGSPVVVIATDIPTTLRRPGVYRGVLHETTDQAAMFAPVTKATVRVEDPVEVPGALRLAVRLALQAPSRPVYLEVPTDVLGTMASVESVTAPTREEAATATPSPDALDRASALIDQSDQVLIWAGGGALRGGAAASVSALAKRLASPVLTTYGAIGLLGRDHPCAVGLPPHVPEAGSLWDRADLVIAIGTDFDGMTTQNWAQPAPRQLVTVNIDPTDAAKAYRPDVVLTGEAADTVGALTARVTERGGLDALVDDLEGRRTRTRAALVNEQPDAVAFLDEMAESLPDTAIVVADMCIPGYWLAGFYSPAGPRQLQYPVGWGTLGYAFPAAIGAALADAGPVVCVCGDGGFLFACGELATVKQERIPLTVVIVDDGGYGMLRYDQRVTGDRRFGVDLETPDFAALAMSFGIPAQTVEGLGKQFGVALVSHVADPTPSVLVARAALDPPPTTSPRWYRRR